MKSSKVNKNHKKNRNLYEAKKNKKITKNNNNNENNKNNNDKKKNINITHLHNNEPVDIPM